MLDADPQTVLKTALGLSKKDRADLAAALIESLDGEPDPDAEVAWAEEIEKRAQSVLTGKSDGLNWETVLKKIKSTHTS